MWGLAEGILGHCHVNFGRTSSTRRRQVACPGNTCQKTEEAGTRGSELPPPTQLVYEAGSLEIDTGRREMRARGVRVPIGGRAFEIIEALARSAGELVTKDELIGRVWPGLPGNSVIALCKNAFAAATSRLGLSLTSTVLPAWSTARYR